MQNFDRIEFDLESNRLVACGANEHGWLHRTPIFRLSKIVTDNNKIIIYDNDVQMFVLETTGKEEVLKKFEEFKVFIQEHKHCASNYMS